MYRAYQVNSPSLITGTGEKGKGSQMNISLHPRCLSLIAGNNINLGFPPFFVTKAIVKMKFSVSNER